MKVNLQENRTQNNIMAASAAICAGAAGAAAGYNFAPATVKNMDELLNSTPDVFCKTIDNLQKSNSIDNLMSSWALIPAKASMETLEQRINNAFPGDNISVKEFKTNLQSQKAKIKNCGKKIDKFISEIINKKDGQMSLNEYLSELSKRDILPETMINIVKQNIVEVIGEDGLNAPNTIDKATIDMFKSSKEMAINIANQEISLYKKFLNLEKDGILYKQDMITSAKKDIKPIIDNMVNNVSFDSIKNFIPKARTKWALIAGGSAAFISAACVKIFGNKNS